jgi:hypothetical protein
MSHGLSTAASANLMDADFTVSWASSIIDTEAWRTRQGNSRPGSKKSAAGNCGLSTIRSRPAAAMPLLWDIFRRRMRDCTITSAQQKKVEYHQSTNLS